MEIIEKNGDSQTIKFKKDELVILHNALNEVLSGSDAIEEWELHARIGATKQEAGQLLDLTSKALDD